MISIQLLIPRITQLERPSVLKSFSLIKNVFFSVKAPPPLPLLNTTPKVLVELLDKDVKEKVSCGGGKGGQAVNKTANKVTLTHLPTGVTFYSTFMLDRNTCTQS